MTRPPLNWREWLEDMRSYNSPDGDRATQILAVLDETADYEQALGFWEAKDDALRELCVSAGLLNKGDQTTDPLPLLAMFLPVD